jgi:hypothetical protein
MFKFQLVPAFVVLLLVGACESSPTSSTSPAPISSTSPAPSDAGRTPVLVGLDWHQSSPSTLTVMRPDGSVISTRTLPATWLVDEHAVGAYMLVANDGSGKGWTVDPTGTFTEVAPAAAAFLSPPTNGSGWTPPLIVDSTTAVTVGFNNDRVSVYQVSLPSGAVRSLLTAPQVSSMGSVIPLTVLDVSPDRSTVWVRKVTNGTNGSLEIVGIDLKTGAVTTLGKANAFLGETDVAISPDGKLVAAQEEAGVDSANLAIRHLHVVALSGNVDSDVQGTAPYTGGQRSPSVLFAPGGKSVAWWGGIDNGDNTFAINVSAVGGSGRSLYQLDTQNMSQIIESLYWVDSGTLVVQTDSTMTQGVFQGEGLHTFTIDATTGAQTPLPDSIRYVVAVLN